MPIVDETLRALLDQKAKNNSSVPPVSINDDGTKNSYAADDLGLLLRQKYGVSDPTKYTPDIDLNVGYNPQGYDLDRVENLRELSQSTFTNAFNSLRRGWIETLKGEEFGRLVYNPFYDSIEATIDEYPDKIRELDNRLTSDKITPDQYQQEKAQLDQDYSIAQKEYQESYNEINDYKRRLSNIVVSPSYTERQQRLNMMGDDAPFVDNLKYAFPEQMGSSMSLMLPQMAAAFGAQFARTAITSLAVPIVGEVAAVPVGVIGGAIAVVGTLTKARMDETYAEIGGSVEGVRQELIEQYITDHNAQNPGAPISNESQIPEEAMRQIRNQSRKGLETLFAQNMTEVAGDVASALLMPMGTLGKLGSQAAKATRLGTLTGRVGRAVDDASKLLASAKNYSIYTRIGTDLMKVYTQSVLEGIEEGNQFAYGDRYRDTVLGLGGYENRGFLRNLIDDKLNVLESISFGIPGVISFRGSGKYADDKEFQTATNSGALLGFIMGGPSTAYSAVNEIRAYKKTKADLINNGLLDIDSKGNRVNAEIYRNYFKNGTTHRLVEAIRNVANKPDENGNPTISEEELSSVIEEIEEGYKLYNDISDQLDLIPKKGFLGIWDDTKTRVVKEAVKDDLFVTSLNLRNKNIELSNLQSQLEQQTQTENAVNPTPELSRYKQLLSQIGAIEASTQFINGNRNEIPLSEESISEKLNILQEQKNELYSQIQEEAQFLSDAGISTTNVDPSTALMEIGSKLAITNLYREELLRSYNNLSKIKREQDLENYYNENKSRVEAVLRSEKKEKDLNKAKEEGGTKTPVESTTNKEKPIQDNPSSVKNDDSLTPNISEDPTSSETTEGEVESSSDNSESDLGESPVGTEIPVEGGSTSNVVVDSIFGFNKFLHRPLIDQYFQNIGIDPTNISLEKAIDILKQGTKDPSLLEENIDSIKEFVQSHNTTPVEQSQETQEVIDDKGLKPGTNIVEEDLTDSIPQGQSNEETLTQNNKDIVNQSTEEDFGGAKILTPLSLATKNAVANQGVTVEFTASPDDQQLTNTSVGQEIGSELTLRVIEDNNTSVLANVTSEPSKADFNSLDITFNDTELDNIQIGVYKVIGGKERLIGWLHTVQGTKRLIAKDVSKSTQENIEFERNALNQIRSIRNNIIQQSKKNSDTVFKSEITECKFGHMTYSDTWQSINIALDGDTRPFLTYVGNNEKPVSIDNNRPIYESPVVFTPGTIMLMLPNEINGRTFYVPTYIKKEDLSKNQEVTNLVTDNLISWMNNQNKTSSKRNFSDWIYTSTKPEIIKSLKNYGVVLTNMNNEDFIYLNGFYYTIREGIMFRKPSVNGTEENMGPDYVGVFKTEVGKLKPNINKNSVSNPLYQESLMNSGLFSTNVIQNTTLKERYNSESSDYSSILPNGQQYQYFTQHTIEFSTPEQTQSQKSETTVNREIEEKSLPETDTPTESTKDINKSEEISEEDFFDALGDEGLYDIGSPVEINQTDNSLKRINFTDSYVTTNCK